MMVDDSYESMKGDPFVGDEKLEELLKKEFAKMTPEQIRSLLLDEP